jgi:hypothetical protein
MAQKRGRVPVKIREYEEIAREVAHRIAEVIRAKQAECKPPVLGLATGSMPIGEADVLVPLSEDELRLKIVAIFKHQSQKDKTTFPGLDVREFWQRDEERNKTTAALVDGLDLPEYLAMESYVVHKGGERLEQEQIPTSALPREPRQRRASDLPGYLPGGAEPGEPGGRLVEAGARV